MPVAAGMKTHPLPADRSHYDSAVELEKRNNYMLRTILQSVVNDRHALPRTPARQVGDFFASAMDTGRLEQLRFSPIEQDLKRIDQVKSTDELFELLADFHDEDIARILDTMSLNTGSCG